MYQALIVQLEILTRGGANGESSRSSYFIRCYAIGSVAQDRLDGLINSIVGRHQALGTEEIAATLLSLVKKELSDERITYGEVRRDKICV